MPLKNERYQKFAEEVASGANPSEAARKAGYSEKNSWNQSRNLLRNPEVQAEIDRLRERNRVKAEVDGTRVTREIAAIAFADVTELFNGDWTFKDKAQIPAALSRSLKSVQVVEKKNSKGQVVERRVTVRAHDKLRALDHLAIQCGLKLDDMAAIAALLKFGEVQRTEDGYRFKYDDGLNDEEAAD
jgi:phage terminase small subunit